MTDEERRIEAMKLALTYVKIRTERQSAIGHMTTLILSNDVVKIAEEFEYYIRMGKPLY